MDQNQVGGCQAVGRKTVAAEAFVPGDPEHGPAGAALLAPQQGRGEGRGGAVMTAAVAIAPAIDDLMQSGVGQVRQMPVDRSQPEFQWPRRRRAAAATNTLDGGYAVAESGERFWRGGHSRFMFCFCSIQWQR